MSPEDVVLAVFEGQRRRLRRFFLRVAGGAVGAEDLLQETLLRAWDHRDVAVAGATAAEDEIRAAAQRYLWRVARNLVIDELRARRRRRRREGGDDAAPEAACGAPGPDDRLEREEALGVLRDVVNGLASARVRACVTLWLDGRDARAIARQLGLGAGQVRGLLQRGRAQVVHAAAARLRISRPAA